MQAMREWIEIICLVAVEWLLGLDEEDEDEQFEM